MRSFESYCASLTRGTREKLQLISPWVARSGDGEILDIGSGTGSVTAALASRFRMRAVTGVELNPAMLDFAQNTHGRAHRNLRFRLSDATVRQSREASVAILSSVLHEVYSFNADSLNAVLRSLRSVRDSLRPGGLIVVRDFVRPEQPNREVILRHHRSDIVDGHDFQSFAMHSHRKVPLDGVSRRGNWIDYKTNLASAYEYLLRKDYHELWKSQLAEHYGFWSAREASAIMRTAGFRVVHCQSIRSEWVTQMRIRNRSTLICPKRTADIVIPPHQILIVGCNK
jgi:SAM-dependent methyltransferase